MTNSKTLDYRRSGVNIKQADNFVAGIKNLVKSNLATKIKAFGSLYSLKAFKRYQEPILVSSTDGVGTKLKIASSCGVHNTVGIDLVAMNVNDIICLGAKPLFFLDYIACGKLDPKVLKAVVNGIAIGLKQADCALIGGETAEMPGMYKACDYDLAGFCVGIVDKPRLVNANTISSGDLILGIESSGLHSNGFSLARKALGEKGIKKYSRQLLEPTRIYVNSILTLLKTCPVKGIAHITGGAFYNKATKILPNGLGMAIEKKSWSPPDIFKIIAKRGRVASKEMYNVFNMGIGMIVVVKKSNVNKALALLNKNFPTHVIGKIIKSKTKMRLV